MCINKWITRRLCRINLSFRCKCHTFRGLNTASNSRTNIPPVCFHDFLTRCDTFHATLAPSHLVPRRSFSFTMIAAIFPQLKNASALKRALNQEFYRTLPRRNNATRYQCPNLSLQPFNVSSSFRLNTCIYVRISSRFLVERQTRACEHTNACINFIKIYTYVCT